MNTDITIKVISELGTIETYDLINKTFLQFDLVVNKFSRFDENSELSILNNSWGKKTKVSPELFSLINTAVELAKLSNGLFDPTIHDLLETYGYDKMKNFDKNPDKINKEVRLLLKNRQSYESIKLDAERLTIQLMPKQKIDLGNIGKGYAIDLAANILSQKIDNFFINAGGDIFAKGKNEQNQKWSVGLSIPENINSVFGTILLDNNSLACSGSWAIKYKDFHHLLNPKTGKPMKDISQSFVIHKSAMMADGLATLLFLTGTKGLAILEEQKIGGLIIKDNQAISNKYFPQY